MSAKRRRIRRMGRCAGLLAALWLLAPAASAECLTDRNGEVFCGGGRCLADRDGTIWCARHEDGDAKKTRDGRVVCGKGQCEKNARGEIFCSSERGGAALRDREGRVRCYKRCEPATADQCESTPAARAQ